MKRIQHVDTQVQGQVLLYEATAAAVALAKACASASRTTADNSVQMQAIELQTRIRWVLEFGIKPYEHDSAHCSNPGQYRLTGSQQASSVLSVIQARRLHTLALTFSFVIVYMLLKYRSL
jgi:hypothetical protein